MDKHWIVYCLDSNGDPVCIVPQKSREAADQNALYRANQWKGSGPYFVAEVVGRTKLVTKPIYELERV